MNTLFEPDAVIVHLNDKNKYFNCFLKQAQVDIEFNYKRIELINEMIKEIVNELIFDARNNNLQKNEYYKKYINIQTKLCKLAEAMSDFDFNNNAELTIVIDYIQFMSDRLIDLYNPNKKFTDINNNYCIGCGEDLGESNPRQYCCKTHCPNHAD